MPPRSARKRGPGWVEVLAGLLLVGLLAGIAVPRWSEVRDRAVAAEASEAFSALQRAATAHRSERGRWPPDAGPGEVPPGLESFLPAGIGLAGERWELDWDHWPLPDGLPRHPGLREVVAISMTTDRPRVGEALGRSVGSDRWYALGDRYTYIIEGL